MTSTLKNNIKSLLLILSALFFTSPPAYSAETSDWHFRIAPYLWAINMNGTTQLGTRRVHIDESFSDILKDLDYAGMLWLEADKGNVGIFLNALYSVLSDSAQDGILSLNAKAHFGLISGGISYLIYQRNGFAFTPYAGFRYTLNDNKLTASIPSLQITLKDNQHWIDPLIGARLLYQFNAPWSFTLAGDIGGTNTSTDFSYNWLALLGYHPQTRLKCATFYAGYRLLGQNYQRGTGASTYVWKVKIAGPILGVAFDV